MTVFVVEEKGRILTDSSLKKLAKEFFQRENISSATFDCLPLNNYEKFIESIKNISFIDWELIYIAENYPPHKLGSSHKMRLCEWILIAEGSLVDKIKEILI